MVWYLLGGCAEESPNVRFPELINLGYSSMKGFQLGACGGLIAGAMLSMRRGKGVTKSTFFQDTTLTMRNIALISGGIMGPIHAGYVMGYKCNREERRDRAFMIHSSTWQNRIDTMTLYGMACGHLFARPDALYGLIGITPGYAVPLGGIIWGGLAGLLLDVPLSILLPNYWAHNEDVDFIYPELVGLEE